MSCRKFKLSMDEVAALNIAVTEGRSSFYNQVSRLAEEANDTEYEVLEDYIFQRRRELTKVESLLKDPTWVADFTNKSINILKIFNYKVESIEGITTHENKVILSIQVDYSFPPVSLVYRFKDDTITLEMNNFDFGSDMI